MTSTATEETVTHSTKTENPVLSKSEERSGIPHRGNKNPDENPVLPKLEFVRLKIPRLIPVELIEAVKGRTFTPEQFLTYQEKQVDNPANFLYALIDGERRIHGYLWCELNILDNTLFVNTFSISKDHWGKGMGIEKAIAFVAKLKEKTKSPRVLWCTSNEKFFAKHNFKRSKIILMEYNSN